MRVTLCMGERENIIIIVLISFLFLLCLLLNYRGRLMTFNFQFLFGLSTQQFLLLMSTPRLVWCMMTSIIQSSCKVKMSLLMTLYLCFMYMWTVDTCRRPVFMHLFININGWIMYVYIVEKGWRWYSDSPWCCSF